MIVSNEKHLKTTTRFVALAYYIEQDLSVSDIVTLSPGLLGDTPGTDRGAAAEAARQLRATRTIDYIDRLWLFDPKSMQVVGEYRASDGLNDEDDIESDEAKSEDTCVLGVANPDQPALQGDDDATTPEDVEAKEIRTFRAVWCGYVEIEAQSKEQAFDIHANMAAEDILKQLIFNGIEE
jgi:hypothetical protein